MTWYEELLRDPRWYDKRQVILERDGFACTKCGFRRELQVHHIKYFSGLKPWEYEDKYLITLCACCHNRVKLGPHYHGSMVNAAELMELTLQSMINKSNELLIKN